MRRLTYILLVFTVLSCKIEGPDEDVNKKEYVSTAQEVETIISSSMNETLAIIGKGIYLHYLYEKQFPDDNHTSVFTSLFSQYPTQIQDNRVVYDPRYLKGLFVYTGEGWQYESSNDFSFLFSGPKNENCKINIELDTTLTLLPIFENEDISVLFPKTIKSSTSVDNDLICTTIFSSEINQYSYNFDFSSDFSTGANIYVNLSKSNSIDDEFISVYFDLNCLTDDNKQPFSVDLDLDINKGVFELIVDFDQKIEMKADLKNYSYMLFYLSLIEAYLSSDTSKQIIEKCNTYIDNINRKVPIEFYYNGNHIGSCRFYLLEDNYKYSVKLVMCYDESGTYYVIPGLDSIVDKVMAYYTAIQNIKALIEG